MIIANGGQFRKIDNIMLFTVKNLVFFPAIYPYFAVQTGVNENHHRSV